MYRGRTNNIGAMFLTISLMKPMLLTRVRVERKGADVTESAWKLNSPPFVLTSSNIERRSLAHAAGCQLRVSKRE